jgi:hypothetical protein
MAMLRLVGKRDLVIVSMHWLEFVRAGLPPVGTEFVLRELANHVHFSSFIRDSAKICIRPFKRTMG